MIRSVIHAARVALPDDVTDILNGSDLSTCSFIRQVRMTAALRVLEASHQDEELAMLVGCSFPDEMYASFEEWVTAMGTDDTEDSISALWHGGGQWMLHGLALEHGLTIHVTSIYRRSVDGAFSEGAAQEVVSSTPGRRVHLAMMHDDDGKPDHFDILVAKVNPTPSSCPRDMAATSGTPSPALSLPPSPPPEECEQEMSASASQVARSSRSGALALPEYKWRSCKGLWHSYRTHLWQRYQGVRRGCGIEPALSCSE
jgi:hypothetical protein